MLVRVALHFGGASCEHDDTDADHDMGQDSDAAENSQEQYEYGFQKQRHLQG